MNTRESVTAAHALHLRARRGQNADMVIRPSRLLLLPLLAASAGAATAQDTDITIYRCTDTAGHVTVQDAPCAGDQSQQVRHMIQPTDPPPRAEPVAPASLQPAPEARPQPAVALHAPRPMYECIRDDGTRYTSDDGDGNPRWISTGWSYYDGPPRRRSGIAVVHGGSRATPVAAGATAAAAQGGSTAGGNGAPQLRFRNMDTPAPPPPSRPPPGHGQHHGRGFDYGYGGGMWVHDECHALPPAEVCSRLRDRREGIRTRFFNAQANERATLNVEERGINARLSEDCGGA